MNTGPCAFELDVLRMLNGTGPAIPWGAALGAALEYLSGSGYATRVAGKWQITPSGVAVLEAGAK